VELEKSSQDSSEVWDLADAIEKEISTLMTPFDSLVRLRAFANQRAEPRRVERSDPWVAEVVVEIGLQVVTWLRETAIHIQRQSEAAVGRQKLNYYDERRPSFPIEVEKLDLCSDYLVNEESLLLSAIGQDDKHTRENQGTTDSKATHPPKGKSVTKRTPNEIFLSLLKLWHKYEDNQTDFNYEPIKVRELARRRAMADGVEDSTKGEEKYKSQASRFFKDVFKGHNAYRILCAKKSIVFELQVKSGDLNLGSEEFRSAAARKLRSDNLHLSDSDDN
jgi:hypothetical protein